MSIVPFHDYALVILRRDFPPMKTRRELLTFMGGNLEANLLWTDYIVWHCRLNPARRSMAFVAWLKELSREQCSYSEWCFVNDMQRDRQFPSRGGVGFDKIINYMRRINADDSTIDSLESLWLKYHL